MSNSMKKKVKKKVNEIKKSHFLEEIAEDLTDMVKKANKAMKKKH